jgi:hypothetical protein
LVGVSNFVQSGTMRTLLSCLKRVYSRQRYVLNARVCRKLTEDLSRSHVKGPGDERVKSIFFINFPISLPSGALKTVLYNSTNKIWKNEFCPKL